MNDRRYSHTGLGFNHSPEQALLATLTATADPSMRRHPANADLVALALFSVLTESQQDRALLRLGWQLVRPPGTPDPADCDANGCRLGREGKGACAAGFSACKVTP